MRDWEWYEKKLEQQMAREQADYNFRKKITADSLRAISKALIPKAVDAAVMACVKAAKNGESSVYYGTNIHTDVACALRKRGINVDEYATRVVLNWKPDKKEPAPKLPKPGWKRLLWWLP